MLVLKCFRGGKIESATATYVRRQAVVFFSGILESSVEFRKAFCRRGEEEDADDFKVELSYRDLVILVGPGSGCDTILNFPLKCFLLYKKNERILGD